MPEPYNTMKNILITLIVAFVSLGLGAQTYQLRSDKSSMQVRGTSNLHDWEVATSTLYGQAQLQLNHRELDIKSLSFNTPAASLKSKKKAMDTITHAALKAKQHPEISYRYAETLSSQHRNNSFLIRARGTLTIAGVSRSVILNVRATPRPEGLQFQGSTALNMRDYQVEPPTALFGTITTDEQITIRFSVTYSEPN